MFGSTTAHHPIPSGLGAQPSPSASAIVRCASVRLLTFTEEDRKLLEELARDRGLSETDTIRHALRALALR